MDLQAFNSDPKVTAAIEKAVEATLLQIGEDPQREGLKKTPHRVGKALQFLTKGYKEDPEAILRSAYQALPSATNSHFHSFRISSSACSLPGKA